MKMTEISVQMTEICQYIVLFWMYSERVRQNWFGGQSHSCSRCSRAGLTLLPYWIDERSREQGERHPQCSFPFET